MWNSRCPGHIATNCGAHRFAVKHVGSIAGISFYWSHIFLTAPGRKLLKNFCFSISSLDNTCKHKANTLRFTDCDLAKLGSILCSKNLSFESFWWTLWCFFLFFFSPEVLQEAVMGLYAMPFAVPLMFLTIGWLGLLNCWNQSRSWEW